MATAKQTDRIMRYARRHRIIRPRDLDAIDVPRTILSRLVDRGDLVRQARGVYRVADHQPTRHTDMVTICTKVPNAIVCLISALEFHELTTQIPHAVWIMINKAGHKPKIDIPSIRVVRASGQSLTTGVTAHHIEGIVVRMTTPAKTVVDCFKYRTHVGLDVAIEALRDCLKQRKATPSDLFEMAKVDRVARIIRPYIEALT